MAILTYPDRKWTVLRFALLILTAFILACTLTERVSLSAWKTPIEYGVDAPASDAKAFFACVKAASEGHYPLLLPQHEPQLGAPFEGTWDDYPATEKLHIIIPGLLARVIGVFPAVNLLVIMAHVLSVLGFYLACRTLNYRWEWSFGGSLLFGFAPYLFARSVHHVTVAYVGHIPLIILATCWAFSPTGLQKNQFRWALIIAAITGVHHVYYTNMLVQFFGFACLFHAVNKRWKPASQALAVGSVAVFGFVLMNFNTFWSSMVNGANPVAVSRTYQYLEYSGFKLDDMFITPPNYWIPALGRWGERYFAEVILKGEVPPGSYLGVVGVVAFLWLVAVSIRNLAQTSFKRPPWESFMVAWIVLFATVGGLNCWIGSLGFVLFRSSTRYTIFILAIALMFAVRRLSAITEKWGVQPRLAVVLVITLIGLWDQVPRSLNEDQQAVADAVKSDRTFAEQMESRLKPNSMVFQVPIMNFPESPAPGITPYDHFRPFLYTNTLRYSFGDVKGHPRDAWQNDLASLQPEALMDKLERYGFSALYINPNGLQDRGQSYLDAAAKRGDAVITSPLRNQVGDLACIFLKPSPAPILPAQAPFFGKGWYEAESNGNHQQRLCRETGELLLTNPGTEPVERYFQFLLQGVDNRNVQISSGGAPAEVPVKANQLVRIQNMKIQLKPGRNLYTFSTDRIPVPTMRGPVSFVMIDFQLTEAPVSAGAN